MEKFHFPVLIPYRHLAGAKTNKEWQKLLRKCPPIESKRKQTSSAAGKNLPTLTTPEELWQNKISMEKPLPEKQKKNKQKKKSKKIRRNVCVNISFHLTRRIGVGCLLDFIIHPPHSSSSGKICFSYQDHICFLSLFSARFFRSKHSKLLFLLHLMMSPWCVARSLKAPFIFSKRFWSKQKAFCRRDEMTIKAVGELLKVNIFVFHSLAEERRLEAPTLEIEIKQPFSFERHPFSAKWNEKRRLLSWSDRNDGNKIVLLSFNYFNSAIMNRWWCWRPRVGHWMKLII